MVCRRRVNTGRMIGKHQLSEGDKRMLGWSGERERQVIAR